MAPLEASEYVVGVDLGDRNLFMIIHMSQGWVFVGSSDDTDMLMLNMLGI